MSAYLVGNKTINEIVQGCLDEGLIFENEATRVGRKLIRANMYSLKVLYGTPVDNKAINQFQFQNQNQKPTDHQVIQSCRCLEYQACEYPSWHKSNARKIVLDIKQAKLDKHKLSEDQWDALDIPNLHWGD